MAKRMLGSHHVIRPTYSVGDAILRAIDAGCILAALWGSVHATHSLPDELFWLIGAMGVATFYVVGAFCGMYRNWRGAGLEREIICCLSSWCFAFIALLLMGYATSLPDQVARTTVALWFVTTAVLTTSNRTLIRAIQRALRTHGLNCHKYAIVGVTELAFQLVKNIDNSPEMGLSLHGFYDDRPAARTPRVPDQMGRCIGNLQHLVQAARNREVDLIYITFPMRAEERIRNVLDRLADSTATVYLVPDFFVFELLHSRWSNIGGLPTVSVFEQPFYGVDGLVKRIMDVVLATVALLLFAFPMILIGMLIKLTTSGPVFFRQRRYGLDGREFFVWKFRSMTVEEKEEDIVQAKKTDPRVTRIGAILRETSLDELPQLFNVLGGTMSLVGPRPHATCHNELFRAMVKGYMLRHKVRPGITGLAQVNGCRGETDTLEKMRQRVAHDHRYIREWSLWLDVRILLRTIPIVLSRENAY
ncbi:MAG: undecaprenyl-phosphate glucose phosphotransferase [Planctomycetota bacterium]